MTYTALSRTVASGADGEKLTKAVTGGSATKSYVGGIEYSSINLEAIYHGEGRITPNGATAFYYEYTVKDHLGNARVNFRASGAAIVHLEDHHFYPFGMKMEGIGSAAVTNKYTYNGKEINEDFGLNLSDYGARWYDGSLGRWWSVDPLGEKTPRWSPYHYGFDNPLRFVDPNGMESEAYGGGLSGLAAADAAEERQRTGLKAFVSRGLSGNKNNGEVDEQPKRVNTGGFDLSGLSPEKAAAFTDFANTMKKSSKLFAYVYDQLAASKKTYKVVEDNSKNGGRFSPSKDGGTLTINDLSARIVSQELFHAFQIGHIADLYGGKFNNIELEGDVFTKLVATEGGFPYSDIEGMTEFSQFIDIGYDFSPLTLEQVQEPKFLDAYRKAGSSRLQYYENLKNNGVDIPPSYLLPPLNLGPVTIIEIMQNIK